MARYCLVFLLLLVACGRASVTAEAIEPLLLQEGDLPAGYVGGQVSDDRFGVAADFPYRFAIKKVIEPRSDRLENYVSVVVFENDTDLKRFYADALPGVRDDGRDVPDIGESARRSGSVLMFIRCHAVVGVALFEAEYREDTIPNYVKRLDNRLQKVLC